MTEAGIHGPKDPVQLSTEVDVLWYNYEKDLRTGRFPLRSRFYTSTPTQRFDLNCA